MENTWSIVILFGLAVVMSFSFLANFKAKISLGFLACWLLFSTFLFWERNHFLIYPISSEVFLFILAASAFVAGVTFELTSVLPKAFRGEYKGNEQEEREDIIYEWEVPPQKK
ncbi:hypothetical protein A2442_03190 [Candidatus Campbellbacteria bacterium RIFOXYC2_FULL_35_25]|uniref:Uncharacterized protein n=1 Tax=Candidatus Campbellbacteria bacterium RIFOXYC2_FULL_35_25 TaxID=1797582 RepID=A0A1F5EJ98_9BACT|nr:MAG: hypothetical protein A2442_03190 [Candidatus Campbellbacteria bacterium RIFOXYC2_FULL_35_25]